MKLTKLALSFFLLFLMTFMQTLYAKQYSYDEVHALLGKTIPSNLQADEYCTQRSIFLSGVIANLKKSGKSFKEVGSATSFALRDFMTKISGYYPGDSRYLCRVAESNVMADSDNYSELLHNLDMMMQAYVSLSIEYLL